MWIGISKPIDRVALEEALRSSVAPREIGLYDELPEGSWPVVTATIETTPSEFPILITFYSLGVEEQDVQSECIQISADLSRHFQCKTICDGSGYGSDDSPFWCIVWDRGESFLADDAGSSFCDGEIGRPVKIIKKIHITRRSIQRR